MPAATMGQEPVSELKDLTVELANRISLHHIIKDNEAIENGMPQF